MPLTHATVGERLKFAPDDFPILDQVLDQVPELRICAGAIKAAREAKLKYPITSGAALTQLLPAKIVHAEGHVLRPAHIQRYLPKEMFPIADERELTARVFVALMRCKDDMQWAARAPAYAADLLKEHHDLITAKEGA